MPIGKNALKRVSNNGYSKVNTSAPDMENSEITEPVTEPKAKEPIKAVSAKTAPKKNSAPKEKKPPVKKPAVEKATSKKAESNTKSKAESKAEADTHPDGFLRYGLGEDLPMHLL